MRIIIFGFCVFSFLLLGCGKDPPKSGKEVTDMQNKEQKEADDAERKENEKKKK